MFTHFQDSSTVYIVNTPKPMTMHVVQYLSYFITMLMAFYKYILEIYTSMTTIFTSPAGFTAHRIVLRSTYNIQNMFILRQHQCRGPATETFNNNYIVTLILYSVL